MTDPYMPTIRAPSRFIGNVDAKILILLDVSDQESVREGKVLSKSALSTLQEALHQAGLVFADVCIHVLIPDEYKSEKWWNTRTHRPIRDITIQRQRALDILSRSKANICLTMGHVSTYICTGRGKLSNDRGYIFPCVIPGVHIKIMPVFEVQSMIWKNSEWRYYLASDLKKASKHSMYKELDYDDRYPHIIEDFQNARRVIWDCCQQKVVSIDIEVSNFQVSHIGLSYDKKIGWSIPFRNDLWSEGEEVALWKGIALLLSNSSITKVGQNFIFDMSFLLSQNAIQTKGFLYDCMIAQSLIFPDFSKGLGFLGSVYLNVPEWKSAVNFTNIKEEA